MESIDEKITLELDGSSTKYFSKRGNTSGLIRHQIIMSTISFLSSCALSYGLYSTSSRDQLFKHWVDHHWIYIFFLILSILSFWQLSYCGFMAISDFICDYLLKFLTDLNHGWKDVLRRFHENFKRFDAF